MYNKICENDIRALREIVGESEVLVGDEISCDYSHDELGGIEKMPDVLIKAETTEEISAVMKYA